MQQIMNYKWKELNANNAKQLKQIAKTNCSDQAQILTSKTCQNFHVLTIKMLNDIFLTPTN